MNRRLQLLPILLIAIAGCDGETTQTPPPPPEETIIAGRVFHRLEVESPLAGVTMSFGAESDVTDAEGAYLLSTLAETGDSLRAALAGFLPEARWVEPAGESLTVGFSLLPIDTEAPDPPGSFTLTSVGGELLVLAWTPPPGRPGDWAGYRLRKSPGDPPVQDFPADAIGWSDIQVSPSREYRYELSTRDASGNLSDSLVVVGRLDMLPTASTLNVTHADADYDRIPFTWAENADADFAMYRLYRSQDSAADSTDTLIFETAVREETGFTDLAVAANGLYSYRLYTYDAVGQAASIGSRRAAAQRFVQGPFGNMHVIALPGTDRVLATRQFARDVIVVSAAGTLVDEIEIASNGAANYFALADGGVGVWGVSSFGHLTLVDPDPLAVLVEGDLEIGGDPILPSAMALLGGGQLAFAEVGAGPPVVFDGPSLTLATTLDLLDDLAAGSLLAADSLTSRLFVAEGSGGRLLTLDLSGPPAIVDEAALPAEALELSFIPGEGLFVAYDDATFLERFDPADLSVVDRLELGAEPFKGRFAEDGSAWWQITVGAWIVSGFALDWGGGTVTPIATYGQVAGPIQTTPVSVGGQVVSAINSNSGLIGICDPSQGP